MAPQVRKPPPDRPHVVQQRAVRGGQGANPPPFAHNVTNELESPVQHLDTLWKMVSAASTVRDLAQEARSYEFFVPTPGTFYLHAEQATVRIARWQHPKISVRVSLQAGFGWRLKTDQDEAGVYLVAKRRAVVGSMARSNFEVMVPQQTYLVLRLEPGGVLLDNVQGTLHISPPDSSQHMQIAPQALPESTSGDDTRSE